MEQYERERNETVSSQEDIESVLSLSKMQDLQNLAKQLAEDSAETSEIENEAVSMYNDVKPKAAHRPQQVRPLHGGSGSKRRYNSRHAAVEALQTPEGASDPNQKMGSRRYSQDTLSIKPVVTTDSAALRQAAAHYAQDVLQARTSSQLI